VPSVCIPESLITFSKVILNSRHAFESPFFNLFVTFKALIV
jgi:hypothetical protein